MVGWLVFFLNFVLFPVGVARAEGRWGWEEMVQEMGGIRMHDVKSKKESIKVFKRKGKKRRKTGHCLHWRQLSFATLP